MLLIYHNINRAVVQDVFPLCALTSWHVSVWCRFSI